MPKINFIIGRKEDTPITKFMIAADLGFSEDGPVVLGEIYDLTVNFKKDCVLNTEHIRKTAKAFLESDPQIIFAGCQAFDVCEIQKDNKVAAISNGKSRAYLADALKTLFPDLKFKVGKQNNPISVK